MKIIALGSMLISASCLGMHEQLNNLDTNYETFVTLEAQASPSFTTTVSLLEAETLAAVKSKYPYRFIENSYKLMQQNQTAELKAMMPEIKRLLDSQERVYGMDHVYYAISATYLLLSSAVLTYACTQDPNALWITTGLLYIGLRIFFITHKYHSIPPRKKIIENHYDLLLKYITQKDAIADLTNQVESSLEYEFDQEKKNYEGILEAAKIHRKLLTLDGGPLFDELYKEFENEFSEPSQAHLSEDYKEIMLDSWVEEKQQLIEKIRHNDLEGMQKILSNWMDTNQKMVQTLLENPQSLLATFCKKPNIVLIEWLLYSLIGLGFWTESAVYLNRGIIPLIFGPLLGVSEMSCSIFYNTGDTMDGKPVLTTLKWYKKCAKDALQLNKLKEYYCSTLDYQKQLSSNAALIEKQRNLSNRLALLKDRRATLKTRIS